MISEALSHAADASGRVAVKRCSHRCRPALRREREIELRAIQPRRLVERRRPERAHQRRHSPGRVARAPLGHVDPFGAAAIAREVHGETVDRHLGILVVLRARQLRDQRARTPGIGGDGAAADPDIELTSGGRGEVELELLERQRRILHVVGVTAQAGHDLRHSERHRRRRVDRICRRVARASARTTDIPAGTIRDPASADVATSTRCAGKREDPLGAARDRGRQHRDQQRASSCAQSQTSITRHGKTTDSLKPLGSGWGSGIP